MNFKILESGFFSVTDVAENEVVLADFLVGDVQSSVNYIQEILEVLELRKKNKSYLWEATGNAHTITITNKSIIILNEFNENSITITDFDYFERILKSWMNFILSNY